MKASQVKIEGVVFNSKSAAAFHLLTKTNLKQADIAKMVQLKPQTVHRIMMVKSGMFSKKTK